MNSSDPIASSARLSHELLAIVHDEPTSVDRIASGLVDVAAATLPDHDAVVTVVVDRARTARAATARPARELAQLEARLGAGPTACALVEVRVVDGQDPTARWPRAWSEALEDAGYEHVLAVPVVIGAVAAGAVTLYGRSEITGPDRATAQLFAHQAALVIEGGRRLVQLRNAVASRDVIGQAKGILMHRFGIDAATAFSRLVEASQDMNVKLVDIARWYVTDQDGSEPSPRSS
ncbi:GAF and ANTAR domain-containing protein [Actinomycetospora soli]|uniref:GAF and ANTAR domain-containing protein n=1 Tax=Actinomycetospora soli TaxID=2893887 RepID=UPI001E2FE01E|nr:GAF and ANTAR domain-containing protein [Actinomycetospora soli]MCD2187466.1 GAF and ANTAR domain-containing protein [Actinomycetospora soli]